MLRIALGLVVLISLVCMAGCGGSTANGTTGSAVINIQSDRVSPQNVTLAANSRVQWINVTSAPRQVVSGTLDAIGNPQIEHIIVIGNTGFTPETLEANLGDTIKFNNLTPNTFNLEIVDTGGQVVASVDLLSGHLSERIEFGSAGKFTYRRAGNSSFHGTLILFGQPNPSGQFQSPVLFNGGTFTAQFDVPEFIDYFILDVDNPNRSFITGTLRIQ